MKLWLILILLSLITYYLVQRSVSKITKTPVWLCWLVMMLPAFIWTAWAAFFGEERPLPLVLIVLPFVICPLLYGWLIQRGRPNKTEAEQLKRVNNLEAETRPSLDTAKPNTSQELSQVRPINSTEEKALRSCFPWNIYYLQHIDYRPQAILCRGKLKTVPEEAYQKIKINVERAFGDRFFLIFQESFRDQPFFALVPNPQVQQKERQTTKKITRPGLALALLFIALITTTQVGLEMSGITWEQLESNPSLIFSGLAYSLALIFILGIHELSQYLTACHYHIRTTLPYFIPFPFFIGTLGAFMQRQEPFPHRKALFDVSIVGPLVGLLATLPILLWGLSLSELVPLQDSNIINFEALDLRFSFLLAVLGKIALGSQLQPGMGVNLHPLAIAGYIGLWIAALNLMPVGQLDGGHIVHAVFGQKTAMIVGQITRFVAVLFALLHPHFWIWAIILWLIPLIDQPALNDVTELDRWRDLSGLLALALLVTILLPLPVTVAQWFNI
ncbi:site-2 protease family protein [Pleurocapsales cyanobacterium LEGE 06147]|nr:site-2 protease family protein [Pleurocapsales cyanobacterium LEGE 06147]